MNSKVANSVGKKLLCCFGLLVLLSTSPGEVFAASIDVEGVKFADRVTAGVRELVLRGVGLLKWKYIIKVYHVALYMPEDIETGRVLEDIPKRLEYYFFVDMKASDFQDTGFQLMAQNVGEDKARSLTGELEALNRLYRDVKSGQRYTLTYLPGQGTEMALDGKPLGLVPGKEFAAAYFSIWLGPNPVSKSLQEGMFNPATRRQ